ncbi:hypothetical protein QYE76_042688 [Lolium multiflorum]|uniref:Secreted protein n=1 Tax=Lolium multiflorum TaxID=4521 RepID=A0AAD8WV49_LOLMU|nr:hypothetical protein QYE76_042688 [Lolium multiflorum]
MRLFLLVLSAALASKGSSAATSRLESSRSRASCHREGRGRHGPDSAQSDPRSQAWCSTPAPHLPAFAARLEPPHLGPPPRRSEAPLGRDRPTTRRASGLAHRDAPPMRSGSSPVATTSQRCLQRLRRAIPSPLPRHR